MTKRSISLLLLASLFAACGGGGGSGSLVPASLSVVVNPARVFYLSGQEVAFLGLVQTEALEEIPDVEIDWTVEPASGATITSSTTRCTSCRGSETSSTSCGWETKSPRTPTSCATTSSEPWAAERSAR